MKDKRKETLMEIYRNLLLLPESQQEYVAGLTDGLLIANQVREQNLTPATATE